MMGHYAVISLDLIQPNVLNMKVGLLDLRGQGASCNVLYKIYASSEQMSLQAQRNTEQHLWNIDFFEGNTN